MIYLALIHQERAENGQPCWGVSFPDVPGCITYADNHDTDHDIQARAAEALGAHLESLQRHGEPIPAPSAFVRVGDAWGVFLVRVEV